MWYGPLATGGLKVSKPQTEERPAWMSRRLPLGCLPHSLVDLFRALTVGKELEEGAIDVLWAWWIAHHRKMYTAL